MINDITEIEVSEELNIINRIYTDQRSNPTSSDQGPGKIFHVHVTRAQNFLSSKNARVLLDLMKDPPYVQCTYIIT